MESTSPLAELVAAIAGRLGRSPSDFEPVITKLRANWVDTLCHWAALTPELKRSLGLPAVLVVELDRMQPTQDEKLAWLTYRPTTLSLTLDGSLRFEVQYTKPVGQLLEMVGADCACYAPDAVRVSPHTDASLAIVPNGRIICGTTSYKITMGPRPTATLAWLQQLGMAQYGGAFTAKGLDDFFALPFISEAALAVAGVTDAAHINTLMGAVRTLRQCSPVEFLCTWMRFLGCAPATVDSFRARGCDLHALLEGSVDALLGGCVEPVLSEMVDAYRAFSSVEETFHWLRRNGFEKYAFHFARYNIPFYALPCVNFFIIDEMGVTHDDQLLLQALQSLKQCAHFDVRAVSFWLRDLELERYGVVFAAAGHVTLHALTQLSDAAIEKLIEPLGDRHKLQTGIREMKEFEFYYLANASLLQELGMERYSQLCALHGIPQDVLPFLTEKQLVDMGIASKADRKKILAAIDKIKHEAPQQHAALSSMMAMAPTERELATRHAQHRQPGAGPQGGAGAGGTARKTQPQGGARRHSTFNEDKSLEELLSFVYGTPGEVPYGGGGGGASAGSARKKNAKKKKGRNRAQSTPGSPSSAAGSPVAAKGDSAVKVKDAVDAVAVASLSPSPSSSASASASPAGGAPSLVSASSSADSTSDSDGRGSLDDELDLDPSLKAQVDGEVEEFRRRLEAAGQSTKAKLTPIFYLGVEDRGNKFAK